MMIDWRFNGSIFSHPSIIVFAEAVNGDPSRRTIFENCVISCCSLLKMRNRLRISPIEFVFYNG